MECRLVAIIGYGEQPTLASEFLFWTCILPPNGWWCHLATKICGYLWVFSFISKYLFMDYQGTTIFNLQRWFSSCVVQNYYPENFPIIRKHTQLYMDFGVAEEEWKHLPAYTDLVLRHVALALCTIQLPPNMNDGTHLSLCKAGVRWGLLSGAKNIWKCHYLPKMLLVSLNFETG